jgi:hypothetical protein
MNQMLVYFINLYLFCFKIVGFLEHQCRIRGAGHLAYPPVVAAGNNANTIHYISSKKVFLQMIYILIFTSLFDGLTVCLWTPVVIFTDMYLISQDAFQIQENSLLCKEPYMMF